MKKEKSATQVAIEKELDYGMYPKERMPFYWIWYFKGLYKLSAFVGIPNDLRFTSEYTPIARWFFYKVAQPSLKKLLDLKQKGYY